LTWDLAAMRTVTAVLPSAAGGCWVAGRWDPAGYGGSPTLLHADPGGYLRPVAHPHLNFDYLYRGANGLLVGCSNVSSEAYREADLADPAHDLTRQAPARPPAVFMRSWILGTWWSLRRHPGRPPHYPRLVRRPSGRQPGEENVPFVFTEHYDADQGFAARDGVALYAMFKDGLGDNLALRVVRADATSRKAVVSKTDYGTNWIASVARFRPVSAGLLMAWSGTAEHPLPRGHRLFGWDGAEVPTEGLFAGLPPSGRHDVLGDQVAAGGGRDLTTRRRGCAPRKLKVAADESRVSHAAVGPDGATAWFVRGRALYQVDFD
jgi:hypothetical protein